MKFEGSLPRPMRIIETKLPGVYVIELERLEDSRGFFARSFCARDFAQRGLHSQFVQCNVSYNSRRGTVRGMHFQRPSASETKLVRCTRGTIHDVVVDLREDSGTFRRHLAVTLSAEQRNALYIPERFAHGFQTLEDETEVFYQMGNYYTPGDTAGLRFDDPKLGIEWPLPVSSISEQDLAWPLLQS